MDAVSAKQKIRIISFTEQGYRLSRKMAEGLSKEDVICYTTKEELANQCVEAQPVSGGLKSWCEKSFAEADGIIFVGAAGIAVRTIAPFVQSKVSDPAVLVADELGIHVISLLSGHLGGGNELTLRVAKVTGADPVITTASDVNGKPAIDLWAKKNDLVISDMKLAKAIAARIVEGKRVRFFCQGGIVGTVPDSLELVDDPDQAEIAVSVFDDFAPGVLRLIPKTVILGVGCRREKPYAEVLEHVERVLGECRVDERAVSAVASIDIKADEDGICQLAQNWKVPFLTYSAEELSAVPGEYQTSEFVKSITGVDNVCERAAVAALPLDRQKDAGFLCRKQAGNGVTAALVGREWEVTFE